VRILTTSNKHIVEVSNHHVLECKIMTRVIIIILYYNKMWN